jgi:hypothetical protein
MINILYADLLCPGCFTKVQGKGVCGLASQGIDGVGDNNQVAHIPTAVIAIRNRGKNPLNDTAIYIQINDKSRQRPPCSCYDDS